MLRDATFSKTSLSVSTPKYLWALAAMSASSFSLIPTWLGIQQKVIDLPLLINWLWFFRIFKTSGFWNLQLSPAIRHHTVLAVTRHRWTHPSLTPARQSGTRFTCPGGMEGWVDFGVGYMPRWFMCPQIVTNPSSNLLKATQPQVESSTWQSQV